MTDYYQVLGIKQSASAVEIKSAYRQLARKRHPDVNRDSEKAARDFALLSLAYHTLIDPQERAFHDQQLYKHDRRENTARQRAVFTTVSLFLSTFFVAMIKPPLWQSFGLIGRAILAALFIAGIWHLITRLREYFRHYTYKPEAIHYSITQEDKAPSQPFTRFSAYAFLIGGYGVSLGIGLLIGWQAQDFFSDLALLFRHHASTAGSGGFSPTALIVSDLVFYPPIAVLIIDTLHALASRIDAG